MASPSSTFRTHPLPLHLRHLQTIHLAPLERPKTHRPIQPYSIAISPNLTWIAWATYSGHVISLARFHPEAASSSSSSSSSPCPSQPMASRLATPSSVSTCAWDVSSRGSVESEDNASTRVSLHGTAALVDASEVLHDVDFGTRALGLAFRPSRGDDDDSDVTLAVGTGFPSRVELYNPCLVQKVSPVAMQHRNWVERLAWASNGRYLVACDWEARCKVWRVETQELVVDLADVTPLSGHLSGAAWSSDAAWLACASSEGDVVTWRVSWVDDVGGPCDVEAPDATPQFKLSSRVVADGPCWRRQAMFHPVHTHVLAVVAQNGGLTLINAETGEVLREETVYTPVVDWDPSVANAVENVEAACAAPELRSNQEHTTKLFSTRWTPNGAFLAVGSTKSVFVWSFSMAEEWSFSMAEEEVALELVAAAPVVHSSSVRDICISSCGRFLATASMDGSSHIFECPSPMLTNSGLETLLLAGKDEASPVKQFLFDSDIFDKRGVFLVLDSFLSGRVRYADE